MAQPTTSIALNTAHVERLINITGTGFLPTATVTIYYCGRKIGTTTSDSSGNVSASAISIPNFGQTADIRLTDGLNTTRTPYKVTNLQEDIYHR